MLCLKLHTGRLIIESSVTWNRYKIQTLLWTVLWHRLPKYIQISHLTSLPHLCHPPGISLLFQGCKSLTFKGKNLHYWKHSKLKVVLHLSILWRATKSGLKKRIFWKQSNETTSAGEISTDKWDCWGKIKSKQWKTQDIRYNTCTKGCCKNSSSPCCTFGKSPWCYHAKKATLGPVLPTIHVCSSFTWWI